MARASETFHLLRVLARLNPKIYDAIFPHGPVILGAVRGVALARLDAVALNPQPLPPLRVGFEEVMLNPQPLPPAEVLRLSVQATAHAAANAAIAATWAGKDAGEVLHEIGDDWCPTPPRPVIPWPRRWPAPWPPGEPYPIDPELATPAVQAEAAMVFQAYAAGIADEGLSAAFAGLADRLVDAALEGSGGG